VRRAIATIGEQTWTPIHYPNAIWDEDHQRLISDAEVAETPFTAFTSQAKRQHVHGRLIVRRVRDANPDHVQVNAQGELFPAWRHHADARRRSRPPRPRDHRAGRRRPQIRPDRPSTIGVVYRERRVAGPGDDRVQPHPRRRPPRLHLPRPGHHRHHPPPVDQRPRPDRPLRPAAHRAPADPVALGRGLAGPVRRGDQPATRRLSAHHQTRRTFRPDPALTVEQPDRPASRPRAQQAQTQARSITTARRSIQFRRWIQVKQRDVLSLASVMGPRDCHGLGTTRAAG
jgi:hypothetical protein